MSYRMNTRGEWTRDPDEVDGFPEPDLPIEERTAIRECHGEASFRVVDNDGERMLRQLAHAEDHGTREDVRRWEHRLAVNVAAAKRVTMPCPFRGRTTITRQNGVDRWECPQCGHEHEVPLSGF